MVDLDQEIEIPVYSKIALDIASRIVRGDLKEKARVMGRSLLAGEYNVSPETIRRALRLLADVDIVEVMPNSGVMIKSRENAISYVDRFNTGKDIRELRKELKALLNERDSINNRIMTIIDDILDVSERFRNTNPLFTLEFEVPPGSSLCGRTIYDVQFWQNTGATIVAIKRDNKMILSPGPYAEFKPFDLLVVTGPTEVRERIIQLIGSTDAAN